MERLLSLDEAEALDSGTVGIKAARLAAARRHGLPVLPGLVVPAAAWATALACGDAAIAAGRPAAARSAVRGPEIVRELTAALGPGTEAAAWLGELGNRLVVRSSTRLDDDGRWSGAFASYGEIAPDEAVTAVLGCWASVFNPSVLARFDRTGGRPAAVGMAVLIQPEVEPEAGGWARLTPADVEIAAVAGHPGPLLAGEVPGTRIVVDRSAGVPARPAPSTRVVDAAAVASIASILERARLDLEADRIEWAVVDGRVVVLQVGGLDGPVSSATLKGATIAAPAQDRHPASRRRPAPELRPYARALDLLVGRRGPLADDLLVPWAGAALAGMPPESRGPDRPLADRFEDAVAGGRQLAALVAAELGWPIAALATWLEDAAPSDLARLADTSVDIALAAAVIRSVEAVGSHLARDGRLEAPSLIWARSAGWIRASLRGDSVPTAGGAAPSRWDHRLFEIVASTGPGRRATGAAPGRAVGRLVGPGRRAGVTGRSVHDILVVDDPRPFHAPWLWTSGGLIARHGSPAAHLCEVARSLHRPAVVAAGACGSAGQIVAIDGSTGELWRWAD